MIVRTLFYTLLLSGMLCVLCGCPAKQDVAPQEAAPSESSLSTPAIDALSAEILEKPEEASLYLKRGILLADFSNESALADFKKAYSLDSTIATYSVALSRQYFEMGDSKASLGVLRKYLAEQPVDQGVLWELANQAMITRQHDEAVTALNQILRTDVQNAEVYFLKGKNFRMAGKTEKAVSSYQTAIETEPDYLDAHLELGVMLAAQGDARGVAYLENALNLDDSCKAAMLQLGKYYQDQDILDEAVSYYERLINLDPQNSSALYNIATVWYGVDSLQKAYRLFDITTKVEPSKASAFYGKGLCALGLGDNDKAIVHFQEALNLNQELSGASQLLDSLYTLVQ